jgi:hypothetical protein
MQGVSLENSIRLPLNAAARCARVAYQGSARSKNRHPQEEPRSQDGDAQSMHPAITVSELDNLSDSFVPCR